MSDQNCGDCILSSTSAINCMAGCGPSPCKLMLVGEAPGEEEEIFGKPFIGSAGVKLNSILNQAGIRRENCFITNVVRCRPPFNRKPVVGEIKACKRHLDGEIAIIKPEVIVCLGDIAYRAIVGYKGILSKVRGIPFKVDGRTVIPTFHPASIVRGLKEEMSIVRDLELAKSFLEKSEKTETEVQIRIIKTENEILQLIEFLKNSEEFSFDLETTSLDWYSGQILCVGISTVPGLSFVIPIRSGDKLLWEWDKIQSHLNEIFKLPAKKIAHNGKFDIQFLKHNGIEVNNFYFDTMIAHHLTNENVSHKLDFLSQYYFGGGREDSEFILTLGGSSDYSALPDKVLWKHCALDVDRTIRLSMYQYPLLEKKGLLPLFENLCMPLETALLNIEQNGIKVNVDKLNKFNTKVKNEIDQMRTFLILKTRHSDFNPNSTKQLREVLYDELGLSTRFRTPKGDKSTSEKALKALASEGNEFVEALLEYRGLIKLKSTYLVSEDGSSGMLRFVKDDGRIHFNFSSVGTTTGRLASQRPNGQNIPSKGLVNIRNIFEADEGCNFIEADYRQIELRLVGLLSKDENLIKIIQESSNLHGEIAASIFGIPLDQITEKQIDLEKRIVFGVLYGAGSDTIYRLLDCVYSRGEVENWISTFFIKYPSVQVWRSQIVNRAMLDGYLINLFGRRRHLDFNNLNQDEVKRQAVNFLPQSTAAEILSTSTILLDRRARAEFPWMKLISTIHDALYFIVPEERIEEATRVIFEVMERPIPELGDVRFPIKMKIGKYWDDKNSKTIVGYKHE